MINVFLALGSNLGDREAHLRRAVSELPSEELKITKVSAVYETAPQGFLDQGWFLNLVLEAETKLSPLRLLERCQGVEKLLQRQRSAVNGPRTIDVDVLFYGDEVIATPEFTVPHPRYSERRFVLEPLAEIAPDLRDPVTGRSAREMLQHVMHQNVRPTAIIISG